MTLWDVCVVVVLACGCLLMLAVILVQCSEAAGDYEDEYDEEHDEQDGCEGDHARVLTCPPDRFA